MTDTLFGYQLDGAEFLAARRTALLADEMGLGKSAQAIRACDLVAAKRIVVVCPSVARVNWSREFEEYSITKRECVVVESRDPSEEEWSRINGEAGVVILSYDSAPFLHEKIKGPIDALILDESHFLKSFLAKRAVAIYGKTGLVRKAKRIWCLSGTPMPNHPGELWPMLVTFGIYRDTYMNFVAKFCATRDLARGGKQILGVKPGMHKEIKALLKRTMLRRKKEDVMKQLPPVVYETVVVPPSPVDLELQPSFVKYFTGTGTTDQLLDRLTQEREAIDKVREAVKGNSHQLDPGKDFLDAISGMANSVATLRRYTGVQKMDAVARMVCDELDRGEYDKIVIFAIHIDVIQGLRDRFSGLSLYHKDGFTKDYDPVTLYGGTPPHRRQKHIDRFQNNEKTKIFIGQITACGTAITLTRANQVLFIEQDWVPGNNAQAAMRVHRIGQTKPVTVRFVGLENSFDSRIADVLRRKANDIQKVFDEKRNSILTEEEHVSKTDTQDFAGDTTDSGNSEEFA